MIENLEEMENFVELGLLDFVNNDFPKVCHHHEG